MTTEQQAIWDEYMARIAQYDLGQELGDAEAIAKRTALVEELKAKLSN